ncbi:MAG: hypothetical protein WD716_13585 [Fimbriimonadaceae bacterium]
MRELLTFQKVGAISLVEGYSPTAVGERYIDRARIDWFAGVDKAVVSFNLIKAKPDPQRTGNEEQVVRESYFVDALRGSSQRIYSQEQEGGIACRIVTCPVLPIAVKLLHVANAPNAETGITIQTLRADGTWGPLRKLAGNVQFPRESAWSDDGKALQVAVRFIPEGGQRFSHRVLRYDPDTGEVEIVVGSFSTYEPVLPSRDVALVKSPLDEGAGTAAEQPARWSLQAKAVTERRTASVSVGASQAHLAAQETFVAYIVDGVLFARRLRHATLRDYGAWRDVDAKEDATQRAGQIGNALAIYTRENGGEVPTTHSLQMELLEFVEGPGVFNGFVVTTQHSNIATARDLSMEVFGYIQGPGGRAIVYLDGHVDWKGT